MLDERNSSPAEPWLRVRSYRAQIRDKERGENNCVNGLSVSLSLSVCLSLSVPVCPCPSVPVRLSHAHLRKQSRFLPSQWRNWVTLTTRTYSSTEMHLSVFENTRSLLLHHAIIDRHSRVEFRGASFFLYEPAPEVLSPLNSTLYHKI
jgi:hypothetical protein